MGDSLGQQFGHSMMSVNTYLGDIMAALSVLDICRLQLADSSISASSRCWKLRILEKRDFPGDWPWRKAHVVETSFFYDPMCGPIRGWHPGPNERNKCNVLSTSRGLEDETDWMWLSGGTDWQGFQGCFRPLAEQCGQPSWVSFRVRIATPELSGAFLALAEEQQLWGLTLPTLVFSYRGDDVGATGKRRIFLVQSYPEHGGPTTNACSSTCSPCIVADKPYDIAVHLNWKLGHMSVFIDGKLEVASASFPATRPLRFAALYNWRSSARTAFSEFVLGNAVPWHLPPEAAQSCWAKLEPTARHELGLLQRILSARKRATVEAVRGLDSESRAAVVAVLAIAFYWFSFFFLSKFNFFY